MVLDASVVRTMVTSERIVQKSRISKKKRQNQTTRLNFDTFAANNLMNSEDWYLDTEATSHLYSSKDVMSDFVEIIADIQKQMMRMPNVHHRWA